MPRPGRTLAVAVYRPLAEQLAEIAAPRAGERVLELSAGDGELTARLRAAVGAGGSVEVIEHPWDLKHRDPPFDLAVSLLATDTHREQQAVLSQLSRVARRVCVAVWAGGALHDAALRAAWRDVAGTDLAALPPTVPMASWSPGWEQTGRSDVARFDGIDQLLMALSEERGITVPRHQRAALRERLAHHVAGYTAADGTMRIPVHMTVLRLDHEQRSA